jgi:hypothetical protein
VSAKPKGFAKRDLQLADDWQAIANTAAGQRIISDLMAWCNVYSTIDEDNPIKLAMAVGENNFAKRVAYLLGLKPDRYPTQMWEDTDRLNHMMEHHARIQ